MRTLALLLFSAIFITPLSAFAIEFTCNNPVNHSLQATSPNVSFMLDRSGSMEIIAANGDSRWKNSVDAIDETVRDLEDSVRFGVGFFSTFAVIRQDPALNNYNAIARALISQSTHGYTHMGAAAEKLSHSGALADSSRANYAIFITDGFPNTNDTHTGARATFVRAIRELCNASTRTNPLFTHAIAFGNGVNPDIINMLAASGSTGSCCNPSDCTNQPIDVCALSKHQLETLLIDFSDETETSVTPNPTQIQCEGGFVIQTGAELKQKIGDLISVARCVFPLHVPPSYPDGKAPADPAFTDVQIDHVVFGNHLRIHNIGDCDSPTSTVYSNGITMPNYEKEGWCFANNRRSIQLTTKFCEEIGARTIDGVQTQLACICRHVGEECLVTTAQCNGQSCTREQLLKMPCSKGIGICNNGVDACQGIPNQALPEICNGLDDNCDGSIDNLNDAEPDWAPFSNSGQSNYVDAKGTHCEFENVCQCEESYNPTMYSFTGSSKSRLSSLVSSRPTECVCQAGLEFYEEPTSIETDSTNDTTQASCSSLGATPASLFYLLLPLGLLGVMRRKRALR